MGRGSRTHVRKRQLIFLAGVFLGLAPLTATYGAGPGSRQPMVDAPFLSVQPAGATNGAGPGSQPAGQPAVLDVQKDKDKTVYTIGARPANTGKDDTDRAWGMLNNMVIDNGRGAHGKGPNNNR